MVRLPESYRASPEAIGGFCCPRLRASACPCPGWRRCDVVEGPSTITREWGQRRITVTCNVRGRDLGSFVAEARRQVSREGDDAAGPLPRRVGRPVRAIANVPGPGCWSSCPLTFVLIFGLLYLTYGNIVDALRVFTGIPFAWVGGIFALWLRDMPFSISAAIGFIALSGVAVLDDMILVSYVRQLRAREACRWTRPCSRRPSRGCGRC